jgi:ribosomal protein L14
MAQTLVAVNQEDKIQNKPDNFFISFDDNSVVIYNPFD